MRVLFITRKYPPQVGGMESFSFGLINNISCEKEAIILNKKQIHLIWWLPYALIKSLFKARKVDYVHLGDGLLAPLGLIIKKIIHKPVAVTVHGLDIMYKNILYQKICVNSLKYLDKVICVSKSTKQDCLEKKIPEKKLYIIPNGIDTNKISHSSLANRLWTNDQRRILLTVGRLVKRKGVKWFIENVMPKLNSNIEYWIVGQGPEKENIIKAIQNNNLQTRIKLLGFIDNKELENIYLQADLFIMPNINVKGDREGFGIVALEAAVHGLPIIAADIDGISEAIVNGKNGYLVESGNHSEFIKKINDLLVFQSLELRKKIFNFTQKQYSWQKISNIYLNIFQI